jgi:hypothetical protein
MDKTLALSHTCRTARRSDSRLLAHYAVTLALAEAPTLKEAVPAIFARRRRNSGLSIDDVLACG